MAKPKVLIVEDEVFTALALRKEFEDFGYDVCELVYYGEHAIEHAEQNKSDVVLMDIKIMGKMNGIEAAQQIHSRFGIPIAFISGYVDSETREKTNAV